MMFYIWKCMVWEGTRATLKSKKSIAIFFLLIIPLIIGGVVISSPGSFADTTTMTFEKSVVGIDGEIILPKTIQKDEEILARIIVKNNLDSPVLLKVHFRGSAIDKTSEYDIPPHVIINESIRFEYKEVFSEREVHVYLDAYAGRDIASKIVTWTFIDISDMSYRQLNISIPQKHGYVSAIIAYPLYFQDEGKVTYTVNNTCPTEKNITLKICSDIWEWSENFSISGGENLTGNIPLISPGRYDVEILVNSSFPQKKHFEIYEIKSATKHFSLKFSAENFLVAMIYFPKSISTKENIYIHAEVYNSLGENATLTFTFIIANKIIMKNVSVDYGERRSFSWNIEPWENMPIGRVNVENIIEVHEMEDGEKRWSIEVEIVEEELRPTYSLIAFLFIFAHLYLKFFLLFPLLVLSAMVLYEDIDKKRIHFLITKSMRRETVYFLKFLTYITTSIIIVVPIVIFLYITVYAYSSPASGTDVLTAALITSIMATFTYGSLFFIMALIVKRPVMLGALYVIFVELFIGSMSFDIQRLTISYFLRSFLYSTLSHKGEFLPSLLGLRIDGTLIATDAFTSASFLIILTLLLLIIGAYILSKKNLS